MEHPMSDLCLLGTRKGLFTLHRGTAGWSLGDKVHFLAEPVSAVLADPRDGQWYAALRLGHFGVKLHRSSDQGATWTEVGVPAYSAQTPGKAEADNTAPDAAKPAALDQIWWLEPGGTDEPGVLWAGTIPGGLFRSGDHGQTWQLVTSLWDRPERLEWFGGGYDHPGIHSVNVDPRDSRHVTVGISCGGVWQTRDSGATWQLTADGMRAAYMPPELAGSPNIQDPHRLLHCPGQPDALWAQHHNGVFRSTDGATTWHEITNVPPSGFGFALAVHPRDPDTAWFVPAVKDECRVPVDAQLVVSRTRDGGRSFEVLRHGLPQQHAYDLVYRHGLAVDDTGELLVLASTTGGLWVSDDQGDHWQAVSNHLPPVYCVGFVPPV
jgi:hypothetical protein